MAPVSANDSIIPHMPLELAVSGPHPVFSQQAKLHPAHPCATVAIEVWYGRGSPTVGGSAYRLPDTLVSALGSIGEAPFIPRQKGRNMILNPLSHPPMS